MVGMDRSLLAISAGMLVAEYGIARTRTRLAVGANAGDVWAGTILAAGVIQGGPP